MLSFLVVMPSSLKLPEPPGGTGLVAQRVEEQEVGLDPVHVADDAATVLVPAVDPVD
jgi:hypothetical protein